MIIKKVGNHFGHMKTLHIRESLPHEDPLGEHLPRVVFPYPLLCSSHQLGRRGTTLSFSQIWELRPKRLNILPRIFIASKGAGL